MSKMIVKVEARRLRNNTPQEREKNFDILLKEFNKRVGEAKIQQRIKEHQYYESKGEKARRKKRESELKCRQEKTLNSTRQNKNTR